MHLIQNSLLLAGAAALEFGASALSMQIGMSVLFTEPEPRGENFGGAFIWLGLLLAAGVFGALASFGGAAGWIAQHRRETLSPAVWAARCESHSLSLPVPLLAVFLRM